MKHLNHITLNTGHIRKTYPNEVNKEFYFVLQRILRDATKPEGAVMFDGYRVKSIHADTATIATVYASDGAPILTTACSKLDSGAIWRMLHETAGEPLATKATDPVPLPYIADRLEVSAALHMDALEWTGDFSRCFGWATLYPRELR